MNNSSPQQRQSKGPSRSGLILTITPDEAKIFFDASKDAFVICELKTGKVIKSNAAERDLLGVDFTQVDSFLQLVHPDDRLRLVEGLAEMNAGKCRVDEARCLTAKGTFRWMEWQSVPIVAENRLYCTGRDISVRKAAEERVHQLAAVVESSTEAIMALDENDKVVTWNRAAALFFGYANQDPKGLTVQQLFRLAKGESFRAKFADGEEHETTCISKSGNDVDASLLICNVFDDLRNSAGYAVYIRDITARKEMQKRVKEFYSTVSHELRTPLTSIRGALGLISSGVIKLDSEHASELIGVAQASSDRLIRLINDILDLQKIENGNLALVKCKSYPSALACQATDEIMGMAKEADVRVLNRVSDQLQPMMVAPDKIVQVMTNILSNAIKFSPEGDCVELNATVQESFVRFSVTGGGSGIPLDQSHKLFGKFQQLDSSDSRRHGGTGLGLAICKALVDQHGGKIGFHNNIEGCTFWFELPYITGAKSACPQDVAVHRSEFNSVPHILLVEDDADLAQVLVAQLTAEGYLLTVASTVASALDSLENSRPDLILLDLLLPDGHGSEIINHLSRQTPELLIPFVVITGSDGPLDCKQTALVELIPKPFHLEHLL